MIRPCTEGDFALILAIINEAAQAYRGIIPADRWTEPYMPADELRHEMDAGVAFWGCEEDRELVGVMGIQHVQDVTLIRHAYVRPARQGRGVGSRLMAHLLTLTDRPVLVGTWAAASWAVLFYEKHGFRTVSQAEKDRLLRTYWSIPDRQVETSVVLADARWFERSSPPEGGHVTPVRRQWPILEFDPERRAVIEPSQVIQPLGVGDRCVLCFFRDVLEKVVRERGARHVHDIRSEAGLHPVHVIETDRGLVAAVHPGVGAPYAAAVLEEAVALGFRRFIACGAAGVLKREIAVGHVVVPSAAVRDEGTSYHYLPPAREVEAHPDALSAIERVLRARGVPYVVGKTWTTDAYYRETPRKIELRRSEGCLTVEMEAAALFAVAQFRGVPLGLMLYGGDDVSGPEWDGRDWEKRGSIREELFYLAMEACLAL
jgi:purine-nucleoside phosphorylase/GNAT superfamily N-acetyltransferase